MATGLFVKEEWQRRECAPIFIIKIGASDTKLAPTWRRRWDSNPRGVLPPTRFRVELVMTTSILLRIAPVLQALIYSIMQ